MTDLQRTYAWGMGDLTIRLDLTSSVGRDMDDPYPAFTIAPPAPQNADVRLRFYVTDDPVRHPPSPGSQGEGSPPKHTWEMHWLQGALSVTHDRTEGRFAARDPELLLPHVLQTAVSMALAPLGGLLLHASAVWRRDQLWVFAGLSGRGKTTIALELADGGQPFALDRVILFPVEPDHRVMSMPTPFGDPESRVQPTAARPVAGICVVEQAADAQVVALSPAEGAFELLRLVTRARSRAPDEARLLQLVARIVEGAPVYRLRFPKTTQFWRHIDQITYSKREAQAP